MDWVQTWTNSLQAAFNQLAVKVGAFLPNVVGAILIILIGFLIAGAVANIVRRALDSIGIEKFWEELGLRNMFKNAGFDFRVTVLLAWLAKWFIVLTFLIAASDVLNMPQISLFIDAVASYVPNVIAAAVILILGIIAGNALGNAATNATRATRIVPPDIIADVVRWPIFIFSFLAALTQLQIAADMVRILFTGIVFALSLALGLAFGLGGREEAKRLLEGMKTNMPAVRQGNNAPQLARTRQERRK